jgi:hypothetical protein
MMKKIEIYLMNENIQKCLMKVIRLYYDQDGNYYRTKGPNEIKPIYEENHGKIY